MDEWICEQRGGLYNAEDMVLDCGFWDWIYETRAEPTVQAA